MTSVAKHSLDKKQADYNIKFSILSPRNIQTIKNLVLNYKFFLNGALLEQAKAEFLAEIKPILQKELVNIHNFTEIKIFK